MKPWLPLAVSTALVLGAGCDASKSPAESTETSCPPPPAVLAGGSAVPVSFRTDVLPVFAFSCAFSSCHGAARPDRIYLGERADAGTTEEAPSPSAIRTSLLEASKSSDMALVMPFRPEESFLMFKLDGNLCRVSSRCPDGCGEPMPKDNDLLDEAKRETLRRWISEGALDN